MAYINKYSELWSHTKMRIDNAENKAKDRDDFCKKMIQRLMKIKNRQKVDYAIAYLKEKGYEDIADMYESKIMMDDLTQV